MYFNMVRDQPGCMLISCFACLPAYLYSLADIAAIYPSVTLCTAFFLSSIRKTGNCERESESERESERSHLETPAASDEGALENLVSNGFDEFQHVVAPPLTGGQSLERVFPFSRYDIVEFGQISHHQEIVALQVCFGNRFHITATTTMSRPFHATSIT